MDGTPREDWQEERGGRIDPLPEEPEPEGPLDADERPRRGHRRVVPGQRSSVVERRLRKVRYEVEVGERGRETGSLL
jgi:hypothetical protein